MVEQSTKEKLMASALDLFSTKGYSATSVDEIAENIGIKGPNLYKYFKGKEDLLDEIFDSIDEEYRTEMGIRNQGLYGISSGEEFKNFCMKQIKYTIKNDTTKKIRRIMTLEQFRNKKMAAFETYHQIELIEDMYTKVFDELIANKVMKNVHDSRDTAFLFTAPITVMIQMADRQPSKQKEALARIEKHIDYFIHVYF